MKGMESLSLNPGHFSSILSTEVQAHTHWTKDKLVNQWSPGKLDICKQQSESRPISLDTVNVKWIIDLFVRNCKISRISRGML